MLQEDVIFDCSETMVQQVLPQHMHDQWPTYHTFLPIVYVVSCQDHTSHEENGLANQVEFLGLKAHYRMYNHYVIQRC